MSNYNLGKIYKITAENADEGDVYIGSTTQTLLRRFSQHKCYSKYNSIILFNKYGIDNCYIELIKVFSCDNKEALLREESKYIKDTKCVNKYIPFRTHHEWYLENQDRIKKKTLDRYYELKLQGVKRIVSEKSKQKTKETSQKKIECECGSFISKCCMKRHQETNKHLLQININKVID
tara:strand:- start:46 stop:579 length:534 start_codon:yes stop_codon:yes gene_type:complete